MSDKPSPMQEFKEFAVKGNVVDLAVGVIIGAAFGKIVTSLVSDIVMPLLSPLTKLVKAVNTMRRKEAEAPAPTRAEERLTEIRDALVGRAPSAAPTTGMVS